MHPYPYAPRWCWQNSFSLFQKRGKRFMEPVYTKFP
jgi:hypothetical protein